VLKNNNKEYWSCLALGTMACAISDLKKKKDQKKERKLTEKIKTKKIKN